MKLHYVPTSPGCYVIERRHGSTRACIGRVDKFGRAYWAALGVGTARWTPFVRTRAEAVALMLIEQRHVQRG